MITDFKPMEIKLTHEVRLPEYSMGYLINGYDESLSPEDKKIIDDYMVQFHKEAESYNSGQVSVEPVEIDPESYFSGNPAFGLPCNVYDCFIYIIGEE